MEIDGVIVIPDIANAHYGGEEMPDAIYHPETCEEVATVSYVKTDAWRGYYEAVPADGWQKIGGGCNCGDWEDTPTGTSNDECESEIRALAEEHGEVIVLPCGGSNVFAIQYDVLARA